MPCNLMQPVFIAVEEIEFEENEDGFFVPGHLISDRLNANGWMVTKEANRLDGQTFVGRPDIEFFNSDGERDHTTGDTFEESLKNQEPFKVGVMRKMESTKTHLCRKRPFAG